MEIQIILLIIFLVVLILSYSLNASKFFNALETNNTEHILSKIDVSSSISPKKICEICHGVSIFLLQIQQDILKICKQNISDAKYLFKIELFLTELFSLENINSYPQFIFFTSHKKLENTFKDRGIPVNIILGYVEIGRGSLLLVTPFRILRNILIDDGCRHMFHEVESVEKARNSNHNMFQKLPLSGRILYEL